MIQEVFHLIDVMLKEHDRGLPEGLTQGGVR